MHCASPPPEIVLPPVESCASEQEFEAVADCGDDAICVPHGDNSVDSGHADGGTLPVAGGMVPRRSGRSHRRPAWQESGDWIIHK